MAEEASSARLLSRECQGNQELRKLRLSIEMVVNEDTGAIESARVLGSFGKVSDDIEALADDAAGLLSSLRPLKDAGRNCWSAVEPR